MFQNVIQDQIQSLKNFIYYIINFARRNNVIKEVFTQFVIAAKDFFTMKKKLKMAKYRVNYQMYKLNQMEQLIAENNEHVFLRGNKLNQTR